MKEKNMYILNYMALTLMLTGSIMLAYFILSLKTAILESSEIPPGLNQLPSQVIYWLGLVMIAVPSVYLCVNRNIKILSIIFISLLVFLSYPLLSPYGHPYGLDSIYAYQICEEISSKGYWSLEMGTGFASTYIHYPAMYLFNVVFTKATGLPLIFSFQVLLSLIRFLVIPPLIYLVFRKFFNEKLALLGVFLYITCPSLINWPHHEGFAILFLITSLYVLIRAAEDYNPAFILVNMILALILVLSHHFTAYLWLFWILSFFILQKIFLKENTTKFFYTSGTYILLFFILFFSWGIYNTVMEMIGLTTHVGEIIINILSPLSKESTPSSFGVSFRPYERLAIYTAFIIVGLYTVIGARNLVYALWKKTTVNFKGRLYMVFSNFFFCCLIILISAILWPTQYAFLLLRIFEFAYVGIIPVTLLGINEVSKKGSIFLRFLIPLSLLMVLIGSNIMLAGPNQRYYYIERSSISSDNQMFLTPDLYDASQWFKSNYEGGEVLSDPLIFAAVGGFAKANMSGYGPDEISEIFGSDKLDSETIEKIEKLGIKYVITHKYMTKYPSHGITNKTYSREQIEKFSNDLHFDLIYSNEKLSIYRFKEFSDIIIPRRDEGGKILVLTRGSNSGNWRHDIFWHSKPLRNFRYDVIDVEKEDLPDSRGITRNYSVIILDSTIDDISVLTPEEKENLWRAIYEGTNALFIHFSAVSVFEEKFSLDGVWSPAEEIRFSRDSEIFPVSLVGDIGYTYTIKKGDNSSLDERFYFRDYETLPENFSSIINARIENSHIWKPWLIAGRYGEGRIVVHAGRGDAITGDLDEYHIGIGRLNPRIIYYLCEGCVQKTFGESLDYGIRIDDTGAYWLINGSVDGFHERFLEGITSIFPRSTHQVYIREDSIFRINASLKEAFLKDINLKRAYACLHDSGGFNSTYGRNFPYETIHDAISSSSRDYESFFGHRPYCWTTPQHSVHDKVLRALKEEGIRVDMENRSAAFLSDRDSQLTWGQTINPEGGLIDSSAWTKNPITGNEEYALRIERLNMYNEYITEGFPYYFYDHHYAFLRNIKYWNTSINLLKDLEKGGLIEPHPQFLPNYAYKYLNVKNLGIKKQENTIEKIELTLVNTKPVRGAGIRVIQKKIDSAFLDDKEVYFIRNSIDGIVVLEELPVGEHTLVIYIGNESINKPRIIWSDGRIENARWNGSTFSFRSVSMPMMWNDIILQKGGLNTTLSYLSPSEGVDITLGSDLKSIHVKPGGVVFYLKE